LVVINVDPGPVYPIASFELEVEGEGLESNPLEYITPRDLGITIGRAALPKVILDAESTLLQILAEEGYPLAVIKRRGVIADQAYKMIRVTMVVDPGPKVAFGPTQIYGLRSVSYDFVYSKLAWARGMEYDPCLIAKTQLELESTGLFSGIGIQHGECLVEGNLLPVEIHLSEATHRTIGVGVSYSTYLGPGAIFNWEHRNMEGVGRRLSLKSEIWLKKQFGLLEYTMPNFLWRNQQLKWAFDIKKERTEGYTDTYYRFSSIVDVRWMDRLRFSYGVSYKQLYSSRSDNNRTAHLLKLPLQLRYNGADRSLDPSRGGTVNVKITPTMEMVSPRFGYVINHFTGTAYYPLFEDNSVVLAFKATIGSINGSSRIDIPPPERFYAGSENTLRGYKYMTVSPLNEEGKPVGGRSIMVYSIESRFKLKKNLGWAFFYEIGNVYSNPFPQIAHKQLQSFGLGLRYCTQVGPLRADIAFPINRRRQFDRGFQFYISIGEAF